MNPAKLIKYFTDLISDEIQNFRLGVYLAKNGAALDDFNRIAITPDFMTDEIRSVRTISSPILDVEAPRGVTLAIVSQDGVPSAPISLGVMHSTDFKPEDQTVWIRARLNEHAGTLDIGSEDGIRILVGSTKTGLSPIANKKISIGNGTGEIVADTHDLAALFSDFLGKIADFVKGMDALESTKVAANLVTPGSGDAAYALGVPALELSLFGSLKIDIAKIKSNLATLKE